MPRIQYRRPEFLVDPITIPSFMVECLVRSGYLTFKYKNLFGSKLNLIFSAPKSGNGLVLGFNKKYFKKLNKIANKGEISSNDLKIAKEQGLFNLETIRETTLNRLMVRMARMSLENSRALMGRPFIYCTFIGLMENGEITHACISSPLPWDSSALCCLEKESDAYFRCWIFRRDLAHGSEKEIKNRKTYYVLENFKTLRKTHRGEYLVHGRSLVFSQNGMISVEKYVDGLKNGIQVFYNHGHKNRIEKAVRIPNKASYKVIATKGRLFGDVPSKIIRSIDTRIPGANSVPIPSKRKEKILDRKIVVTIDPVEQMDICGAALNDAMRYKKAG